MNIPTNHYHFAIQFRLQTIWIWSREWKGGARQLLTRKGGVGEHVRPIGQSLPRKRNLKREVQIFFFAKKNCFIPNLFVLF